jgi:hypothetical protein
LEDVTISNNIHLQRTRHNTAGGISVTIHEEENQELWADTRRVEAYHVMAAFKRDDG